MTSTKTIPKFWDLLALFTISVCFSFWISSFSVNLQPLDTSTLAYKYTHSQYVMGEGSDLIISDADYYTFAGIEYAKGADPTTISFEHTPLAKYFIGLSWFLTGRAGTINLFLYAGCLWFVWLFSKSLIHQPFVRLLPLLILSTQSLLPAYASVGMLDTSQLFFTLMFLYGLLLDHSPRTQVALTGLGLGGYVASKYFFPTVLLPLTLLLWQTITRRHFRLTLYSLILAASVYISTYIVHFLHHPNPIEFLRFEWFRFRWWTGERTMPKFLLIDTILTGSFKGWWAPNSYEHSPNWNFSWPLLLFGWLAGLFTKTPNRITLGLGIFSTGLLAMYLFGGASNERFLIQLLPFWAIFTGLALQKIHKTLPIKLN